MKRQDYLKYPSQMIRNQVHVEEINKLVLEHAEGFVDREEKHYMDQINEIIDDFISFGNKKMILISGPTSAGKTTTAKVIGKRLKDRGFNYVAVSLDDFFIPLKERALLPDGSLDYESFNTIDVKRFNSFIKTLINKHEAIMPIYNFVTGTTEPVGHPVSIDDNSVLVVEGLHALNPGLLSNKENNSIAYRVYIHTNDDFYYQNKIMLEAENLRLIRRSLRDYYKRGANVDKTLEMWQQTIESENIYIKPFKYDSDYIINSSSRYELMLYANYLKPLLDESDSNSKLFFTIVKILDACEKLDISYVPEDSVLWDFLVDELKQQTNKK